MFLILFNHWFRIHFFLAENDVLTSRWSISVPFIVTDKAKTKDDEKDEKKGKKSKDKEDKKKKKDEKKKGKDKKGTGICYFMTEIQNNSLRMFVIL